MSINRHMHRRTGRDSKIAQAAPKRESPVGAGYRAIHSSEHAGGITRWRIEICTHALMWGKARSSVIEIDKPGCICNAGSQLFSTGNNLCPLTVHHQSAVP